MNILGNKYLRVLLYAVLSLLALFLLAQSMLTFREYQFAGLGVPASNTITVSGKGEIMLKPDIAEFSITVREEAKKQADAQNKLSEKINKIINYLESNGVDRKDIKTSSFNLSPRYDWIEGKRDFRGYEISQTLNVKVRDLDKAGELLAAMSKFSVDRVGSLQFKVEDPENAKSLARSKAISNAKDKARQLARELGVSLVRVVGFSENSSDGNIRPLYYAKGLMADMAEEAPVAPDLPSGENKISVQVNLEFEIR